MTSADTLRRTRNRRAVLGVLGVAAIGLILQSRTYLNHDVAYILWGARKILDGAIFGRDLIDPNPPLAWWLALPISWLSLRVPLPIDLIFRLAVIGTGTLAIALMIYRLGSYRSTAPMVASLGPLAAIFFFITVGRDFGQREHLAVLLVLPYLIGAALRLSKDEPRRSQTLVAIFAGVLGGVGFSIKPFFCLVPILVEGWILWRIRRLSAIITLETLCLALIVVIYVAAIYRWAHGYLDVSLPWARQFYWAFGATQRALLTAAAVPATGIALLLYLRRRGVASSLGTVFGIAASGFLAVYWVQGKAFAYQIYPVAIYTALASAALLQIALGRREAVAIAGTGVGLLLAFGLFTSCAWWLDFNKDFGRSGRVLSQIVELVDRPGGGPFATISNHPIPAFPTALYVSAPLVNRSGGQLYLHTVAALREGRLSTDPVLLAQMEANAWRDMISVLEEQPATILIDIGNERVGMGDSRFDFLAFYLEDPIVRSLWSAYAEAPSIGRFRIFLRRDAVQP